jgi:CBS domain-containing protein
VMVHDFESIAPDMNLREAAGRMKALHLDPLPVCEDGRLVGMVTLEGVQAEAERFGLAAGTETVRAAMSTKILSCSEDDDIETAAEAVQRHASGSHGGALVLDRSGAMVGIVSRQALGMGREIRPAVTGAEGAAHPKVDFDQDPVDHMSEESFPASDPPAPPSTSQPGP